MKRRVTFLRAALAACLAVLAATGLARASAGSTAMDFLRLEVGPRQVGMGGVGVGLGSDVYSQCYNPAWLSAIPTPQAGFSHVVWLQDIRYQDFLYALPTRVGSFGLRFQNLDYGDIAGYDDAGDSSGNFSAGDRLLGLAFSRSFAEDRVHAGASFNMVEEKIADAKARANVFDLGGAWFPFSDERLDALSVALAVKHLGPSVSFDAAKEPLPRTVSLGFGDKFLAESVQVGADISVPDGQSPRLNIGGEFTLLSEISLRAGFETGQKQGPGLRTGVGFRVGMVQVDYAFLPMGDLGMTHHVGLILRFGGPDQNMVREGLRLMRANRPAEAILKFDEALRINARNVEAAEWLRRAYRMMRRDIEEAR